MSVPSCHQAFRVRSCSDQLPGRANARLGQCESDPRGVCLFADERVVRLLFSHREFIDLVFAVSFGSRRACFESRTGGLVYHLESYLPRVQYINSTTNVLTGDLSGLVASHKSQWAIEINTRNHMRRRGVPEGGHCVPTLAAPGLQRIGNCIGGGFRHPLVRKLWK